MQGTTDFDDAIANPAFEEADGILNDATALDAAIHMLNPDPTAGKVFIGRLLIGCQGSATGLLLRCLGLYIHKFEAKKATILQ